MYSSICLRRVHHQTCARDLKLPQTIPHMKMTCWILDIFQGTLIWLQMMRHTLIGGIFGILDPLEPLYCGYTFHILAHLDHLEDSWRLETRRCSATYSANSMLLSTLQAPSMSSPQSSIRFYWHFFVKVTCLFKVSRATQQPVYMKVVQQVLISAC